jgi:signal transduction histidine kinase
MSLLEHYGKIYESELERLLGGAGEEALSAAYELGRRARADGLGILDVVSFHQEAVLDLVRTRRPTEPVPFMHTAWTFLIEVLSPFEMSYRTVDEANVVLRRLNELLEDEAKRIAHALHDQAASIVASASLELDLAVGELPPQAQERLAGVRRLLDETGDQLRHLSHELRPTILDDLGLKAALEFLAEGFMQRTGIKVDVRGPGRERYPPAVETAVYRIAQEALNNAFVHGGESPSVTITLRRHLGDLHCTIVDDGLGFDVDSVLAKRGDRGLGVLGMRERANAVGGVCEIRSRPGNGTTIEIVVPIRAAAAPSEEAAC